MDSIEAFANRWQSISRTPESETRPRVLGSSLAADRGQSLPLPAAATASGPHLDSEPLWRWLIEPYQFPADEGVIA